jgi:dihydrodipicolinate synthase/N-acetylneuraminate lyase
MHPNTLRNKLSGVIAFPVTPFKEDLSLDLPALHLNLTHLLQYQISAIVAASGTGEMYSLTPA